MYCDPQPPPQRLTRYLASRAAVFRWLRILVLVMSAVVCVAMFVAWPLTSIRSFWVAYVFADGTILPIELNSGCVLVFLVSAKSKDPPGFQCKLETPIYSFDSIASWGSAWIGFRTIDDGNWPELGGSTPLVAVSDWLIAVLAGMVPIRVAITWMWLRRRQRKRVAMGQCLKCGYDLRASPNRCPECGTAAPRKPGDIPRPF